MLVLFLGSIVDRIEYDRRDIKQHWIKVKVIHCKKKIWNPIINNRENEY